MTDKRFKNSGKYILQNNELWGVANSEHWADVISTALNELINENNELKKENWILLHFFEQVYYDYLIRCGADDDKELMEMSNAFQSRDLREILRYCIGETDKEKLRYYGKLYKVDLE